MDTSYRKRFRWQKADKELTSIHVVIKRRSLVNPIKSSAPLNRLFDPERHNLIVHLHMKNTSSGKVHKKTLKGFFFSFCSHSFSRGGTAVLILQASYNKPGLVY